MNKPTKVLTLILTLVLCATLFAGCGGSSSSASTATSTKQETASASAAQPAASGDLDVDALGKFEFSFTCHDPDTSAKVQYMQGLCDEVYEKTNGGVKMTMYNGGTLVSSTDVATAVEDGTADIGWLYTTFFPGEFPYTEIITMPMTFDTNIQANEVLLDLIANNAQVQEELSRYHLLSASTNPMNNIYTNKEITDASSFKGQAWRCTAGCATEMAQALGASPVLMGPGDVYESIEKNVLDGYIFEPSGVKSFNLQEVTKYYLDTSIYCGVFLVVMNKDKWDSLPAEYQQIITEVWDKGSIGQTEVFNADAEAALEAYAEAGLTAVEPTDDILAALDDAAQAYISEYIATNNCQDLFDEAMSYKANH